MNYRVIQTGHNSHLLISYDTVVAGVNKNLEITLYSGWDYGRTTVGHVMRFINGYTPTRVYGKKSILSAVKNGKIIYKGGFECTWSV